MYRRGHFFSRRISHHTSDSVHGVPQYDLGVRRHSKREPNGYRVCPDQETRRHGLTLQYLRHPGQNRRTKTLKTLYKVFLTGQPTLTKAKKMEWANRAEFDFRLFFSISARVIISTQGPGVGRTALPSAHDRPAGGC